MEEKENITAIIKHLVADMITANNESESYLLKLNEKMAIYEMGKASAYSNVILMLKELYDL